MSIIIPTYNAEAYLEKCLQSIVEMELTILQKCEVVVVNDGSPDNSAEQEKILYFYDIKLFGH